MAGRRQAAGNAEARICDAIRTPFGRRAGSLTWAGLYNTYYWIDPATRVAGVIMMQILPFADRPALKVYRDFEHGICRAVRRV